MLAIIYDVHGNLPALDAVLADAERAGARTYLLGGDYAAFGAWPAECVARLQELSQATWIRGNWERWQGAMEHAPQNEVVQGARLYANERLGWDLAHRLAALPVSAERGEVLFCHASPIDDMTPFPVPGEPDAGEDRRLLAGTVASTVVFGHTHVQYERHVEASGERAVRLVNAGSAGLPWDGDVRAAYALLDDGGRVELRRVDYDVERAGSALEAIDQPWATTTAARLRAASFAPEA